MSQKSLLVLFSSQDLELVGWARAVDRNRGGEGLVILCVREGDYYRMQKVSGPRDDDAELLAGVWERLGEDTSDVEVLDGVARRASRAVMVTAADIQPALLILHGDFGELSKAVAAEVRHLAKIAPYDLLLFDPEGEPPPGKILVAQVEGRGGHALQQSARCFGSGGEEILAIADPEHPARSERRFEKGVEKSPKQRRPQLSQVMPENLHDGIIDKLAPHDLLLIDANERSPLPAAMQLLRSLRTEQPSLRFSVGVTRAATAAGQGRFARMLESLRQYLPRLDRERRLEVHEQLETGGQLSADFVVMLTLSTAIAALGLIQSSTAVVVGAMLVAPLMTPIIAMGMGLVQANPQLFRRALLATVTGIMAALGTAAALACLSPWSDLSAEIVARGSPNLFDLAIALFSGIAGAYAIARPGAMGALVGVAIAVALVPPLASVGIALVKADWDIAFGAGVLFLTNLFAIVAGSTFVFRAFGLDASLQGRPLPYWVRVSTWALLIALVPIVGVLVFNLEKQMRSGVQRDYARPLAHDLRHALRQQVAAEPGVEIVIMARSEIEDGFGVKLILASEGPRDPALIRLLRSTIESYLGAEQRIQILWLRNG